MAGDDSRSIGLGFKDRLVQFCDLFPSILENVPSVKRWWENCEEKSRPHGRLSDGVDRVGRLSIYQAWCFLLKEAAKFSQSQVMGCLVEWMVDFHGRYPLHDVEGAVEIIRIYLTIRMIYQSNELPKHCHHSLISIVGANLLGPILPFMQTSCDVDQFNDMVAVTFQIERVDLFNAEALNDIIKRTQDMDNELLQSMGDMEEETKQQGNKVNSPILDMNKDLAQYNIFNSSGSESESEEHDDDDDDDDDYDETGTSGKSLDIERRRSIIQTKTTTYSVLESYATICTAEYLENLHSDAFLQMESMPIGAFEKKVLLAVFKDRKSRSAGYFSLMTYLSTLGAAKACGIEIDERFKNAKLVLLRFCRQFPPSLGTVQAMYVNAVQLATISSEYSHPVTFQNGLEELVEETKQVMDIAFESAQAVQKLEGSGGFDTGSVSSLYGNGGGLSGAGGMIMQQMSFGDIGGPAVSTSSNPRSRRQSIGLVATDESWNDFEGIEQVTSPHSIHHNHQRRGPVTRSYDPEYFSSAPKDCIVARLDQIWLQIDPNQNSAVNFTPDIVGQDECTSIHPGRLRVYKNRISWVLVQPEVPLGGAGLPTSSPLGFRDSFSKVSEEGSSMYDDGDSEEDSDDDSDADSISTHYKDGLNSKKLVTYDVFAQSSGVPDSYVIRFSDAPSYIRDEIFQNQNQGKLPHLSRPKGKELFRMMDSFLPARQSSFFARLNAERRSVVSSAKDQEQALQGKEIRESLFSLPMSQIKRYMWGHLDRNNKYLAIYTVSNEVIKLFPFAASEITEIIKALHDVTGLKPTTLQQHHEDGFKLKLEEVRQKVLDEKILTKETQWISHTEELLKVLKDLTKDDTTIKIVEIERLFHSCRNNKAVIYESINILKELWNEARTQVHMLKILTIVDRFMDVGILSGSEPILADVLKWLHQIETSLDPYSNATPLKMLLKVCQRAENLQAQTIVPLVEIFYDDSIFDLRPAFEHYIRKFA